ncbi:MAG: 3-beta hydroxysteroid dehydrogenase [Actinomycetota bacterium]|nr:3-beta hydroxysteroid dehydrogenase [Actinomycetota bacterium]
MRVAVAGATGVVGAHVMAALLATGHDAVPLARSVGVDIVTGSGLGEALVGADAVIDVSNITTTRKRAAVDFFDRGSRNLVEAGRRCGLGHHIALSIVGIDDIDYGYYQGKLRQEQIVLSCDVPSSVLRATQFHEFPGQLLDRVPGPLAVMPRMTVQPVAAQEVAAELVAMLEQPGAGLVPELAGPEVHDLVDLARKVLRQRRSRRALLPIRIPGPAGGAMRGGGLLPKADGPRGRITFGEWLARRTIA